MFGLKSATKLKHLGSFPHRQCKFYPDPIHDPTQQFKCYPLPSTITCITMTQRYSTMCFHSSIPWLYSQGPQNERTTLRVASHMRLRARDHHTSSTLIGGKSGAGSSSLHTTLEGATKQVNARWMQSLHGFLRGLKWIMFHAHLDYFQKPPLGSKPNTKLEHHNAPNAHNRWFILSCTRTCMNRKIMETIFG
jgi:hypothetical protein